MAFQRSIAKHEETYGSEQTWKTVRRVLEEAWNTNAPTDIAGMVGFSQITAKRISETLARKADWERAMTMCASVMQECMRETCH